MLQDLKLHLGIQRPVKTLRQHRRQVVLSEQEDEGPDEGPDKERWGSDEENRLHLMVRLLIFSPM